MTFAKLNYNTHNKKVIQNCNSGSNIEIKY